MIQMKILVQKDKCNVELHTDRRDSISCQQLKESKSKLLTANEMGHSVMIKLLLSNTLSVQVVGFALLQ